MSEKVYSQGKFDPNHPLITQSFLNMAQACMYAAYRRYICGDIVPPGVAALQGTATDAAVTYGCETKIKTGQDARLLEKVDLAVSTFNDKKKETQFFPDDNPDELQKQVIGLVELHHKEIAPSLRPVKTQDSILIKGEVFDTAGTLDLVEENHVPADTKTAGKSNEYPDKGFIQAAMYTRLYENKYRVRPDGVRFDVLVKTKTPKVERVTAVIGKAEDELLDHVIAATVQELQTSLKTGVFRLAETGHWRCNVSGKWCGYLHNGCPKGKRL